MNRSNSVLVVQIFIALTYLFIYVLRNDAMEDRYSVLIKLNNQLAADGFYGNFNGKRFSPAEVCFICLQQFIHIQLPTMLKLTVEDYFFSLMIVQAEVCHILYVLSVDYTEEADIASTPPTGFTELPTCPICLGW